MEDIKISAMLGSVIRIKIVDAEDPGHYAVFRITTDDNSIDNGEIGDIFLEEIGGE
jgi:hypothetical protein